MFQAQNLRCQMTVSCFSQNGNSTPSQAPHTQVETTMTCILQHTIAGARTSDPSPVSRFKHPGLPPSSSNPARARSLSHCCLSKFSVRVRVHSRVEVKSDWSRRRRNVGRLLAGDREAGKHTDHTHTHHAFATQKAFPARFCRKREE